MTFAMSAIWLLYKVLTGKGGRQSMMRLVVTLPLTNKINCSRQGSSKEMLYLSFSYGTFLGKNLEETVKLDPISDLRQSLPSVRQGIHDFLQTGDLVAVSRSCRRSSLVPEYPAG